MRLNCPVLRVWIPSITRNCRKAYCGSPTREFTLMKKLILSLIVFSAAVQAQADYMEYARQEAGRVEGYSSYSKSSPSDCVYIRMEFFLN